MPLMIDDLRRYAVARSLFAPTTLAKAIDRLGFVQADPIRAPARAQDLTLRHRVKNYHAGDLERRYASLPIEEDFFVNYGFVPRATHALMHPRTPRSAWPKKRHEQAHAVLEFVRERGVAHPREVDAHFSHGRVKNWFGGSSRASTHLLDDMHYRGLLRIAGRDAGVRTYAAREPQTSPHDADVALDALIDVIVGKYAPLPARSLGLLVSQLRGGTPQWSDRLRAALARAKGRLPTANVEGLDWYWPVGEDPGAKKHAGLDEPTGEVRLLAPFDPIVWDRLRFELFWGWAYRFEAYTPPAKRKLGYYAMPMLWQGRVIGWGNLSVINGNLKSELGYVAGRAPRERAYRQALEAELDRFSLFLRLDRRDSS